MRALITDLDNTLYDWVTYFSNAFDAMVQVLSIQLSVSRHLLFEEFKSVHRRYRNSEQPFAVLELPSVIAAYPGANRRQLAIHLGEVLKAFDDARDRTLALYPGVSDGLRSMSDAGIILIGLTDAVSCNVASRLSRFGIERFFTRVYCRGGQLLPHPFREDTANQLGLIIRELPPHERKPDPAVLLNICELEALTPSDSFALGDSLARDIKMANRAGIKSIWAKYGANVDSALWAILVAITHWTDEDVAREAQVAEEGGGAVPDYVADDFRAVAEIVLA